MLYGRRGAEEGREKGRRNNSELREWPQGERYQTNPQDIWLQQLFFFGACCRGGGPGGLGHCCMEGMIEKHLTVYKLSRSSKEFSAV